jgi:flagellar protein FlaG
MASDSFTTAIFLITAIVAAAVLVNAFFPIIFTATNTFTKSSAEADERLRTDVRIINTYASAGSQSAKVWIKNVGSIRIADTDIENADLFIGSPGDFDRLTLDTGGPDGDDWNYQILEDANEYWDEGETVRIDCMSERIPSKGEVVYFHIVLPGGVMRSIEFTAGD